MKKDYNYRGAFTSNEPSEKLEPTLYAEYITGYRTVNETTHKIYIAGDKNWMVFSTDKMTKEVTKKFFRNKIACWNYIISVYGDDVMVVKK